LLKGKQPIILVLADEIFVAYALPGGSIEKLMKDISYTGKTISSFKTG